jgi:hypothetical protein
MNIKFKVSTLVVVATETCRNIAWLYKYVLCVGPIVDSNLVDMQSTNNGVKYNLTALYFLQVSSYK